MIANSASEIIWAVVGAVVSTVLLSLLIIGLLKGKIGSLKFKAGGYEGQVELSHINEKLEKIRELSESTNGTVNHRRKDEPTLAERMRTVEEHHTYFTDLFKWQNTMLKRIAHHVGIIPDPEPTPPQACAECSPEDMVA